MRLYHASGGAVFALEVGARMQPRLGYAPKVRLGRIVSILLLLSCAVFCRPASAYSLLTHEQLIDLTWKRSIVPLLLSRYPTLTPEQLEHARAYAYGGCVIQDIGYYPFGDAFFSDLTHYVRSGDFVVNLFRNAGNADELAFAIGALSHYVGDSIGHSEATNLSVPVEFPKLRAHYGPVVNYAEGEHQHVQTEFAFDIDEIAHHRLAPVHYLRHVGLEVPTQQVSLAFYQTYGLREDLNARRAARINVGGYRFAVRRFIPRIAYAVNVLHRKHEPVEVSDAELARLNAAVAAVEKDNDWAAYRKKPGIGTYSLAAFLYILPKIGPLKLVAVKGPTEQTEQRYVHSVLDSVDALDGMLRRFTPPPAVRPTAAIAAAADKHADSPAPLERANSGAVFGAGTGAALSAAVLKPEQSVAQNPLHPLANRDLDTGNPVRPAGYRLTDETYAKLLHRLTLTPAQPIPPGIKAEIEAYYTDLSLPFATRKDPAQWAQVQADLKTLAGMPTSTELEPFATYDEPAASE